MPLGPIGGQPPSSPLGSGPKGMWDDFNDRMPKWIATLQYFQAWIGDGKRISLNEDVTPLINEMRGTHFPAHHDLTMKCEDYLKAAASPTKDRTNKENIALIQYVIDTLYWISDHR